MATLTNSAGALSIAPASASDGTCCRVRGVPRKKEWDTAKLSCSSFKISRLSSTEVSSSPHSALTSSKGLVRGSVQTNCSLLSSLSSKKETIDSVKVETAGVLQINSVTKFFVETFFLDGQEVRMGARRQLEGGQGADIRSRYNGQNKQACMLYTKDPEKGGIVGCVGLEVAKFDGKRQLPPDAYTPGIPVKLRPVVANLAVSRSFRRRGLAKALMQDCEDRCRDWGYDEILLFVEKDNSKARRLYSKLGYRKQWTISTGNSIKLVDGVLSDVPTKLLCLRKSLKPGLLGFLGM